MDSRLEQNIYTEFHLRLGEHIGGAHCHQNPHHQFLAWGCVFGGFFFSLCHECPQTSPRKWWQKKKHHRKLLLEWFTHGLPFKQSLHGFFLRFVVLSMPYLTVIAEEEQEAQEPVQPQVDHVWTFPMESLSPCLIFNVILYKQLLMVRPIQICKEPTSRGCYLMPLFIEFLHSTLLAQVQPWIRDVQPPYKHWLIYLEGWKDAHLAFQVAGSVPQSLWARHHLHTTQHHPLLQKKGSKDLTFLLVCWHINLQLKFTSTLW